MRSLVDKLMDDGRTNGEAAWSQHRRRRRV